MALVLGTNCGFVTTAPTADPDGYLSDIIDTRTLGLKLTSPGSNAIITEMGWYTPSSTSDVNFEMGIYSYDDINDLPLNLLGVSRTNSKGTGPGWKVTTGLSIPINANTVYYLATYVENTTPSTNIDFSVQDGTAKFEYMFGQTTLPDEWVDANEYGSYNIAAYAVYEIVEATNNVSNVSSISGVQSITI